MIGSLVSGLFMVLLGAFGLYPAVKEQTEIAIARGDFTGFSLELLKLIPTFFIVAVVLMSCGVIMNGLRNAGLWGSKYEEEYLEEQEKRDENHRQTYYEYVQERIAAQKAIRGRWW